MTVPGSLLAGVGGSPGLAGLAIPCHAPPPDPLLFATLALAGAGSILVGALAAAVAVRRRSPSRVLVALAVGALVARTAIGGLAVAGTVPFASHHTVEHGLDVVMVGLVLAAAYAARRAEQRAVEAGVEL
jgi:hypothetical protein